ncbi:ATP-binding protein [Hymenobacter sp. UYCo722]|uniref:ATP-binding protein n=1 Tax=Hymenobacter sp. UYCo722 TaxID=3156335 RepID=UPI00339A9493
MPDSSRPALPADLPPAADLLQTILGTSQNGIMLLRPVYDAAGTTIIDLAWAYLNPAARRLHTHVEGTGVGLYMVRRIVENAGGSIQVASQPGIGTTFTVCLPEVG